VHLSSLKRNYLRRLMNCIRLIAVDDLFPDRKIFQFWTTDVGHRDRALGEEVVEAMNGTLRQGGGRNGQKWRSAKMDGDNGYDKEDSTEEHAQPEDSIQIFFAVIFVLDVRDQVFALPIIQITFVG